MNLQESIKKTMGEVSSEIIATKKSEDESLRKLNILKASVNKIVSISPHDITMESNVRHSIDRDSSDFKKLCESIQKFGLMKNIVAELRINEEDNTYNLICVAGHRRLTALNMLGMANKIPCLIKQYQGGDRVGAALSENLNREGLNCIDIADGYKELKNSGWNDEDLIKHFEKNKKTIAQYLRLAELPGDVKELIRSNPNKLSTRTLFQNILAKNKTHGEIRKAIKRKIDANKSANTSSGKIQIKKKLEEFFISNEVGKDKQNLILKAFYHVGVLKP